MRDALCYQKRPFSWYQPAKLGVPINQLIARNFALSSVLAPRMKRAIIREFFLSLNHISEISKLSNEPRDRI